MAARGSSNAAGPERRIRRRIPAWAALLLLAGAPGAGAEAPAPNAAHAVEPSTPPSTDRWSGAHAGAEVHASLLTDATDKALLSGTYGWALRGGWRFPRPTGAWGLFLHLEQNLWLASELGTEVVEGAFQIGVGGELIYADGFVRTALAAGPSILAFDTALDPAGTMGFFLDLRPVGLRWSAGTNLVLGLDPISFAMVAPVLSGIPLVNVEYRSTFTGEWTF